MDLTIGSFHDPARFVPRHHFGAGGMHRAWINTEGLPEQRSDRYRALVERWMNAIGKLPD
ncbi:MAG: glutathione-dependent formaldehyde-activating [Alphaproteobacteria bacterium]|nr:glutathione-dependent formaldehyde-activating [Alphaproteobacteria bacterium]